MESFKRYFAEFFGTFVLVLFACGTAVVTGCNGNQADAAYFLTALAFGLTLTALVYVIGPVSGCHVNPAVSLALWMEKKLRFWDFLAYLVAQFAGAIAGSAVLSLFVGSENLGQNAWYVDAQLAPDAIKSILIELVLTCLFVLTILGVTSKAENGAIAGVVIGLSLTLVHIFGIHFTGTSVNPARSLGPALLVGGKALSQVWVFLLGPILGAILAVAIHTVLTATGKKKAVPESAAKPAAQPVSAKPPIRKAEPKKAQPQKTEPEKAEPEQPADSAKEAAEKEPADAQNAAAPEAVEPKKSAPAKRVGGKTGKKA